MKAAIFGLLFLIVMIVIFANRNDKNKKKLQKHVANGDIDPAVLENVDPSSIHANRDACKTRETFRQLANQ